MTALLAQTAVELRLLLRRGEALLLTIAIPAGLLVFFSEVEIVDVARSGRPVDFLVPGTVALAVIATALVATGISTGFDRQYGVLKRLGGSPLGKARLLGAKGLSVLVVEAAQCALLLGVGTLLGWRAGGNAFYVLLVLLLATAAFAGLGLALAGTLRAEGTLAATNGLFLVFLLLGDAIYSLDRLPEALEAVGRALPAAAFAGALRAALTSGAALPAGSVGLLAAWAVASVTVALLTFRWE